MALSFFPAKCSSRVKLRQEWHFEPRQIEAPRSWLFQVDRLNSGRDSSRCKRVALPPSAAPTTLKEHFTTISMFHQLLHKRHRMGDTAPVGNTTIPLHDNFPLTRHKKAGWRQCGSAAEWLLLLRGPYGSQWVGNGWVQVIVRMPTLSFLGADDWEWRATCIFWVGCGNRWYLGQAAPSDPTWTEVQWTKLFRWENNIEVRWLLTIWEFFLPIVTFNFWALKCRWSRFFLICFDFMMDQSIARSGRNIVSLILGCGSMFVVRQ